ncbi:MAG: plastocyanin/azurin family copper-binding protein [Actinomycetota bacterium]
MRRSVPSLLLLVLVLLLAPHASAQSAAAVSIQDNAYSPATVTVDVGGTVTWTHSGQNPHSVTADDGSFDSSPNCSTTDFGSCMEGGDTFSHTFPAAGTFAYYCRIHGGPGGSGMSGTVTVEAAPTTPAPTTTAPGGTPTVTPLPHTGPTGGPPVLGLVLAAAATALALATRRRSTRQGEEA